MYSASHFHRPTSSTRLKFYNSKAITIWSRQKNVRVETAGSLGQRSINTWCKPQTRREKEALPLAKERNKVIAFTYLPHFCWFWISDLVKLIIVFVIHSIIGAMTEHCRCFSDLIKRDLINRFCESFLLCLLDLFQLFLAMLK